MLHATMASGAVLGSGIVLTTRNPTLKYVSIASGWKLERVKARKVFTQVAYEPPRIPRNEVVTAISFHSETLPP